MLINIPIIQPLKPAILHKDSAKVEVQEKYPARKIKLIHTRMYQVALGFRQMYLLSRVARKRGISVVNGSSFSYLDCFDRVRPSLNDESVKRGKN